MKDFKIRASGASNIMGGSIGLTNNQVKQLDELLTKDKTTDNQAKTIVSLIDKRDNPVMPEGMVTYCKMWLKVKIYNRFKEFTSKYTEKGKIMEDGSLDYIADQLGYGMLIKNVEFFEDKYFTGTPDVILKDHLIDVKNSWDCFTFPLFETEIDEAYYYQAQVYMHLTGVKKYKLIYVLSDTPIHLIEKEAYWWCKNNGYDELDEDVYNQFVAKMTYPDIADSLKYKVFDIDYSEEDIIKLIDRVKACRVVIKKLNKTILE